MGVDLPFTRQRSQLSHLSVAVTEHSPWPMATVEGSSHTVCHANRAFCRLLGRECADLVGKPFREILPENHECAAGLERVLRSGKSESHTQKTDSQPDLVFWSYTMWPVMEEQQAVGVMIHVTETARFHDTAVAMNEALVLGSLRQHQLADSAAVLAAKLRTEIEERTWTADALRASEERFRVLFNLGPVAIFSCDRRGIIQNFNRRAAELWGRNPQCGEHGEDFSDLLKIYHSDGQPITEAESPILGVLKDEVFVAEENVFIQRADGTRVAAGVTFVPLKDRGGEIVGTITAFYDITERRQLENSLVARADDLVRADRSKDEFLAMLAHELRNPLAPLRNAAEVLGTVDAEPAARDQAQGILKRQIENMSRMVDDLLDVARITEGKIELRKEPIALETIVDAAASLARPGIEARRQELTITLPAEPVVLEVDATRLEQVLGNLLTNASKYSNAGAHISLSAERVERVGAALAEVILRVRDEGIGIAPDLLPRIFDLFVQATPTSDRALGGLGLGLTLVQRLVKLHGGSIEARSKGLGHGSEFIIHLPVFSGPLRPPVPQPPPPPREVPRRILIVDDNEDSARSMSLLQRLRGHETRTAFTGPDALAAAPEFTPDVVLLDIGLPGMDGFEVARRLRAIPAMKRAFLVAMTGYGNPKDRTRARSAGFDEYLVKPVDLELLREWLRRRD